jgi:hypothetical protein
MVITPLQSDMYVCGYESGTMNNRKLQIMKEKCPSMVEHS